MFDNLHALAIPRPISDAVAEYDSKVANIHALIAAFESAKTAAESGACISGTYTASIWERYSPSLSETTIKRHLLESAWLHVYNFLNIPRIAPASDRSQFELAMKNPPPFTVDNIRATFGRYIQDPRSHILRGLAEVFGKLDPAFKSHDRMKIGVKGLPKRIILSSVTDEGHGGWGTERLSDMIQALATLANVPPVTRGQFARMLKDAKHGEGRIRAILESASAENRWNEQHGEPLRGILGDIWLKRFSNGNGHLFFGPDMLVAVNRALAEYYGEVIPDCPEERPAKAASTAVAKDLQFYRTPQAAADRLIARAGIRSGMRILEPSCGDGALLDALSRCARRNRLGDIRATGIEVDPGRAEACRAKGYGVHIGNFLQVSPKPDFDLVIMNPPFYGKHYQKHVEHARKFLKPGGRILAILPITAVTDHNYITVPKYGRDVWEDLPTGSFAESGTNINTGIAVFYT